MSQGKSNVDGYIHQVSSMNTAKSGSRYFDFVIQENEEERRVVCFSPDKRSTLKTKQESRLPVRLVNLSPQKRRYDPDTTEYTMNKYSRIEEPKNLSFEWKSPSGYESDKVCPVAEIISKVNSGESVTVAGKVIFKSETETVFPARQNKELTKCDLILGDSTSAIVVTIWEDQIADIQEGGSYCFSGLRVNFFNRKYLNVVKSTRFQSLEKEIELPAEVFASAEALKPKPKSTNCFSGSIVGVDCTRSFICVNCKVRIKEEKISDGAFVRCGGCNWDMLKATTKALLTTSLIISTDDGDNAGRYLCTMEALKSLFEGLENISEKDVSKLDADLITETLLLVGTVEFSVCSEERIIKDMRKACESSESSS